MTRSQPRSPRLLKPKRTVSIIGTGSYVPEHILTNAELEKLVDTSDEWIVSRTGIKERRIAAADEYTSDLAANAARRAIEQARDLFPASPLIFIKPRQLAQRGDHPLPWTALGANTLHQAPILVLLAILLPPIAPQKHGRSLNPPALAKQGGGLHYNAKRRTPKPSHREQPTLRTSKKLSQTRQLSNLG